MHLCRGLPQQASPAFAATKYQNTAYNQLSWFWFVTFPWFFSFSCLLAIIKILSSCRERLDTSLKIPGKSHTGFLHPPPATRSCRSKGSSLCHWSSSLCWLYNFCQHHQTKGFFSQSHTVYGMSPTYPFYLYDVHYLCEQKTGNSELCLPRLPQPSTTKHLEAA